MPQDALESGAGDAALALTVTLPPDQFEALAQRVGAVLAEGHDDRFLDVEGAANYLSLSRKAVYHLVERRRLPHHKPDGRLLFDRAELRAYVERG